MELNNSGEVSGSQRWRPETQEMELNDSGEDSEESLKQEMELNNSGEDSRS